MAVSRLLLLFSLALVATVGCDAALVEHTFIVSQIKLNHLCNDTLVTVVNGQLPGPAIEVTEGDSVVVHVINRSPHGVTIHWHGLKQQLNCWADGASMITQCPIQPNMNLTYRFDVTGQEGTLWWHAHVSCLRGTIHGALIIRPRSGTNSYPFPKPDKEIPIVIGEWWDIDLVELERRYASNMFYEEARSATINGMLGDLNNCSGVTEDNYILNMDHGKRYLLRIVNAALKSEYYLKIARHVFTVVAADANYVKPYTTDTIAIAPGETVDALVIADARPGRYYMVAKAIQSPKPMAPIPVSISSAIVQYSACKPSDDASIMVPEMPEHDEAIQSFYFHGNLTSLHPHLHMLPVNVEEKVFIAIDDGYVCRDGGSSCVMVSVLNNISFQLPTITPLLHAHYNNNMTSSINTLREFPITPPSVLFNYSQTSKATSVWRVRYNTTLEIVFQGPTVPLSYSNPMHLHGHDFFVVAQGLGNYDAEKDVQKYNLVDPPVRNTVLVPIFGWTVIRLITNNPGVWFLHCHIEHHVSSGMGVAFVVENGPTLDSTLPPPPADFLVCDNPNSRLSSRVWIR